MRPVQRGQRNPYIIPQPARESCEGDRCKPVAESSQEFFFFLHAPSRARPRLKLQKKMKKSQRPVHGCATARSKSALSRCGISKCWDCTTPRKRSVNMHWAARWTCWRGKQLLGYFFARNVFFMVLHLKGMESRWNRRYWNRSRGDATTRLTEFAKLHTRVGRLIDF